MYPALVKTVMRKQGGFNVINMKPTGSGRLWKHGEDTDALRWVHPKSVVKIPAPPQLVTQTTRYVHYRIPEMEAYGWGI